MSSGTYLRHSGPGPERWGQVSIRFASDEQAERETVTRLGPVLEHAESAGTIDSWFFIRKPWWRFRYLLATCESADSARQLIEDAARQMANADRSLKWAAHIYEPETRAFGGESGMTAAHKLFHQDSRHVLAYLSTRAQTSPDSRHAFPAGRRELSLLLVTAMMKAAGLDLFERGDAWAKVADLRPPARQAPAEEWRHFKTVTQRLITADTSPATALRTSGTLRSASTWLTAFEQAGITLRQLADEGTLTRGLRAIVAHHVIFHWNRIGLPARTQANMALAASEVIFGEPPSPDNHFRPGRSLNSALSRDRPTSCWSWRHSRRVQGSTVHVAMDCPDLERRPISPICRRFFLIHLSLSLAAVLRYLAWSRSKVMPFQGPWPGTWRKASRGRSDGQWPVRARPAVSWPTASAA